MASDGILWSDETALNYARRLGIAARQLTACADEVDSAERSIRAMDPSGKNKVLADAARTLRSTCACLRQKSEDLSALSHALNAACDIFEGANQEVIRKLQICHWTAPLPEDLVAFDVVRWDARLVYTPHQDWLLRMAESFNPFSGNASITQGGSW